MGKQLPGARWAREVPIEARIDSAHGEKRIDGRIDLLLETEDTLIVVDHKSFPGVGDGVWRSKAAELAPQLGIYLHALRIARPGMSVAAWIHFITASAVVTLEARS